MSGGHNIATQLCRMNRSRLETFPLQLHLELLPLALAAAVHAEVAAGSPRVVAARALAAAPAEARAKASATLLKVFGNVAKEPSEAKYRQLKLSNAAVAAKVVAVDGAVAFLRAAGWTDAEGGEPTLTLPEAAEADRLAEAMRLLELAAAGGAALAPPAPPAAGPSAPPPSEPLTSKEAVQRRIKELFTHFAAAGVAANEAVALAMKQAQEEAAGGK